MAPAKRVIALLLTIILTFGMFPVNAFAQESGAEPQTTVDNGDMTIEGTNGFGTLLANEIEEQNEQADQDASEHSGGYNVIGLTIENGTATVEYSSLEEATLVVALYSEDGLQMLTSATAEVSAEETVAEVTFEGTLPQYFLASAYLLDMYDYSPLCASYETPMYTQEMQELLASTVADYDADRVLNLDGSGQTNFAVYAEDTILIEEIDGVNTVASINDETATYVIENADETISSLQTGDVFAYAYGEGEILIVKVASMAVDGTTVTITGDDLEMEEVFSHVKMETSGDSASISVEESAVEEGVVYEGLTQEGTQTYGLRAIEGESSKEHYLNFKFVDKKIEEDTENVEASVKLNGKLGISLKISLSYYVAWDRQFVEFKTDVGIKATLSASGKITGKIPLGAKFKLSVYGASIGFEPQLQLKFSGKIEYSFFAGMTIGMSYENGKGIHNLNTVPKVESEFKVEASVFFGIDLNPKIEVLDGAIAEAELEVPIGFELEGNLKGTWIEGSDIGGDSIHACEKCVDMELKFKAEFSAKLKFLKSKKLSLESKVKVFEAKIGDMYWSIDHNEFAWGTCPHISYRVTVVVKDPNGQTVSGAAVSADWKDVQTQISIGKTNSNGVVITYLETGRYIFKATNGGSEYKKEAKVEEACKVSLDRISCSSGSGSGTGSGSNSGSGTGSGGGSGSGSDSSKDEVIKEILNLTMDKIIAIIATHKHVFTEYVSNENATCTEDGTKTAKCENCDETKTLPDVGSKLGHNFNMWEAHTDGWAKRSCSVCGAEQTKEIPAGYSGFCGEDLLWKYDANTCTLTISGTGAMYDMDTSGLIPWDTLKSDILRVEIGSGVTRIGDSAFLHCSSLSSVTIPDSVTCIGEGAFLTCSSLSGVTIPGGVISIEDYAFSNCSSLNSVTIPGGVTNIGYAAFGNCSNLTGIWIDESNRVYSSDARGVLFDKEKSNLIQAPGGLSDNYIIPDGVTSIGNYAFSNCSSLNSVTIPGGVTNIGDAAFENCSNLTGIWIDENNQVYSSDARGVLFDKEKNNLIEAPGGLSDNYIIPDSVTSIGYAAFYKLSTLSSVTIPASVTNIGDLSFGYCPSLSSVTIPSSVTNIGYAAFTECSSLTDVYYAGTNEQWNAITIDYENSNLTLATIHFGITSIPEGDSNQNIVVASGECGAEGDNVTWKLYSNGLLQISGNGQMFFNNDEAPWFSWRDEICRVTIDRGVTRIGDRAFYEYCNLMSVSIPESVTSIEWGVFYGCSSLASISIPASVTSIADYAFAECSSLTGIWVDEDNPLFSSDENGVLFNKGKTILLQAPNALSGDYSIPSSVNIIDGAAFTGCSILTSVSIPDSITGIGGYAFDGCSSLTAIVIPASVKSIGYSAFIGCNSLAGIWVDEDNQLFSSDESGVLFDKGKTIMHQAPSALSGDYSIPSSVNIIDGAAFTGCSSLTSVSIPNGVTSIGEDAFFGCSSLTSVNIPEGVTSIGEDAFFGCSSLTSVNIPEGVTSIEDYTFYNCSSLTSVNIPNSITSIDDFAFCECSSLTSITIPDSVTSIGEDAFSRCSSLTNVSIPDCVTSIEDDTFYNCSSLTSLAIPASVTSIGNSAFQNCTSLTDVYYTGTETQWNAITVKSNNDVLISATIYYGSTMSTLAATEQGSTATPADIQAPQEIMVANEIENTQEAPVYYAVWGGEYGAEKTESYTLRTASFTGLVPGADYVLLVMARLDEIDILAPSNLLYIHQSTAAEDGTLEFCYVQRLDVDISYVAACGASHQNLKDAVITFPEMYAINGEQAVAPMVVYEGKTLTEGLDYVLLGTVDFAQAGEYQCSVRGIYNYTGLVNCTYMVKDHEHVYQNYVSSGDATCTADGTKTGKCIHCEETETVTDKGSKLPHSWDKGVITTHPTDKKQGVKTFTCTVCGATKTEKIPVADPAHSHSFGDWEVTKMPTGAETGVETRKCSCGAEENREIPALTNPFEDVAEGKFYYEPVLWAYHGGITTGKDATHFNPSGFCTRSQVVTFLWRAAGEPEPTSTNNPFPDVPEGKFYTNAVLWAVEKGITGGYKDGTFGPNDACTRGQIVTFLWRYFGEPEPVSSHNPFPDVPEGKFYTKAVLWAVEEGVTGGYKDGTFGPNKTCTRDQIVTFLYRAMVE